MNLASNYERSPRACPRSMREFAGNFRRKTLIISPVQSTAVLMCGCVWIKFAMLQSPKYHPTPPWPFPLASCKHNNQNTPGITYPPI